MTKAIPSAALAQHIAIVGKTGSGKTTTGKLAVEQVVADGSRVCILDPIKSDWWGLTSSADGKHPGLPFSILGGPHAHVPLHAGAGAAIGELVATGQLRHSILDMSDFRLGGHARFFVDFSEILMKRMRGVLYLVLEEAHLFAPKERSGTQHENMAIHFAKLLATAGRTKGIRLLVLTQRTQALHNALLGSCDTLIAHRLTAPADQVPIVKWLKANCPKDVADQVAAQLSSLKTGSGWLCSGEAKAFELIQFPRISTFDNTKTPDSDAELRKVVQAPVDREALRAIIGDAVKDAEENDVERLKQRIRELEARTPISDPVVDQAAIDAAEQRGFERANALGIEAQNALLAKLQFDFESAIGDFHKRFTYVLTGARSENPIRRVEGRRPAEAVMERRTGPAPSLPRARQIDGRAPANGSGEQLPRGEAAILGACIQFPAGLRREQFTVLTGFKRSTRDTYIQRLRERAFVEVRGDRVHATSAGVAALPDYQPLPTGRDLQAYWFERLPEGERAILKELVTHFPRAVPRADLDRRTGFKRSTRDTYLQRLSAKQLVDEPTRGEVRASQELFS